MRALSARRLGTARELAGRLLRALLGLGEIAESGNDHFEAGFAGLRREV